MPEPSDLEKLLALALPDKRKCDERHSMKREGCPDCEADDMRGRTAAKRRLEALAPALAQELIEKRNAGQALTEALEASKETRLATGRQSTCARQVHGDSHIQCGKCFICLERKALNRWAKLTETEVRDG